MVEQQRDRIAESSENPRVLVAICTLNEAENVALLLPKLRDALPSADLLVVDDYSPDGTAEIATRFAESDGATRVLVRDERGLGGAIQRAMVEAIDGDYTYLFNLDADFSHNPNDLPSMLRRAGGSDPVDVVVGSRYVLGGEIVGWPIHRKWMSRTVNAFATLCLRLPVKDCSGSMRCYRVATLKQCDIATLRSNGYAVLEEVLVRMNRNGARMAEVPIIFTDRQLGKSKLTLREAVRSMVQIVRMIAR